MALFADGRANIWKGARRMQKFKNPIFRSGKKYAGGEVAQLGDQGIRCIAYQGRCRGREKSIKHLFVMLPN